MNGADLERRLGHSFADPEILKTALTHSSRLAGQAVLSNERMEFLGDRVLGLVIAEMVYRRFGGENEGRLARRHAALVSGATLARIAARLDLGGELMLSPGEEDSGGRENPAILADCCEAVIAAIYLDGGLEAAARFITGAWADLLDEVEAPPKDAKSTLQEWAQGRGVPLPSYREVERSGPAHAPRFVIEVVVEGLQPVTAEGSSKREAERLAAARILEQCGKMS